METSLVSYSVNPVCCNGCGACVAMAPELFAMNAQTETPVTLCDEAPREAVEQAMAFCPHDCIELG